MWSRSRAIRSKFCIRFGVSRSRTHTEVYTRFSNKNDTWQYKIEVNKYSEIFAMNANDVLHVYK